MEVKLTNINSSFTSVFIRLSTEFNGTYSLIRGHRIAICRLVIEKEDKCYGNEICRLHSHYLCSGVQLQKMLIH